MIYTNQLPKIKVEFSDTITISEIKTVKAWAKENAETLKDYAADKISHLQHSLMTPTNKPIIDKAISKINHIVKCCECGLITDHEAVAAITNAL